MTKLTERKWFGWARDIAVVLALYAGIRAYHTWDVMSGPAPAVSPAMLDGGTLDLAGYRGAPVLVYFWATWCNVCRMERHNIEAVAEDLPVVSVVSSSGSSADVRKYVEDNAIGFPVALDPDAAVAKRFGVSAYPTAFVIDGDGQINSVEPGYTTELGLRLRMWWAAL